MSVFLFLSLCSLGLVQSQCISSLVAGFAMDELGGAVLRDSVASRTIAIPSNISFSTTGNPQGVSSLVLSGGASLVLPSLTLPSSQFTITTWFKSTDGGEDALFSWMDSSFTYTFYARLVQGRVGVVLNTLLSTAVSSRTYNDGQWHLMALTYTRDTQLLQIHPDPHLQATDVVKTTVSFPAAHTVFQLGGMQLRAGLDFAGELDDFRVFDRVLSLDEMQRIGRQLDSPCNVPLLIPHRAVYQSAIPNYTSTTFSFDPSQGSVCGVVDPYGRCTNNRYGIALTACAGNIAAVSSKLILGGQVYQPRKDTSPTTSTCSVSYDASAYSGSNVESARLCASATRITPFQSPSNPIASGAVNTVSFTSGPFPLRLEISFMVADQFGSFNPPTRAFTPQTDVPVTCNGNSLEARWSTPVLNNGLTCNSCSYQAWYVPMSMVVRDRVNLWSTCGVRAYGFALPDTFTVPYYNQFVLPAKLPVPGDVYVWTVVATSQADGLEGVVAVLDKCPVQSASVAPSMAPSSNTVYSKNWMNSNTLVLNMIGANFPPPRTGFINQFVTSIARVLNTDVQRISYTNFTDLGAGRVANGFDILPPVYGGFDNRTAGTLALLMFMYQRDQTSPLYQVLSNTNPDPGSFTSDYEKVPVWTATPKEVDAFPWEYIVLIVACILGAICLCCLIYACYHHKRGRHEKPPPPRRVDTKGTDPATATSPSTAISSNSNNKPRRFYNDDEKHNTDHHINFSARSPTRGSDLAAAKRFASSPDTQSDPVSYKGATTMSSSSAHSDGPHMDPRDWRTVVALHGRNGTVDAGDLVFKAGDVIRVVGPCDGPHWFEGELENGSRGMVPVNHVKGQMPVAEVRLHHTDRSRGGSTIQR